MRIRGRRPPTTALVLALGTVLGGCVHAPSLPDATVSLPSAWRGAAAVETGPPFVYDQAWWRVFGDPELDALINTSLADNLDVQQAMSRLDAARAFVRPVRAQALPQVTGSASARSERRLAGPGRGGVSDFPDDIGFSVPGPDRTTGVYQAGFDASWEPDLFARARNAARSARASAGIAQADLRAIRVTTASEVARAYLDLRSAQNRRALLRDIEAGQRVTLTAIQSRLSVGLASEFDVDRARSSLAETGALISRETAQIEQAAQRIARLLGRASPPPELMTPKTFPAIERVSVSTVPADLVRTRPDIFAAEQAVLQAAADAGVARADLYPRLSLGGTLSVADDLIGQSLGGRSVGLSGGPTVSLPLFDWGARRAVVDAREAQLAAAVTGYRLAVLEGVAQVEAALASLQGERERVALLTAAVSAARRVSDNSDQLFKQGLTDVTDRLAAEASLRQTEINLSEARLGEALSVIALHQALGGAMGSGMDDERGVRALEGAAEAFSP